MSFILLTGLKERMYLLESYLNDRIWGFLEMYNLLNEDVVSFCHSGDEKSRWPFYVFRQYGHPDLLISLLISRCPVSCNTSIYTCISIPQY